MSSAYPSKQATWSAEFCGCGNDNGACCITCCLPCVTFGQIAEILDEGQSSCVMLGCVYGFLMLFASHWLVSFVYREELRAKFGLPADPCTDCFVHCCCAYCALCQEHAELKNRGFDPSKGWVGPPTAPPPQQIPPAVHKP